jgi:putative membrane protein
VSIDLLVGTLVLRPYVFGFLAAFLAAGAADLGWRRTLLFAACVSPVAWLAEFSSTRTGIPFGLYHYTGETRGQELFVANVPFMDPLSFSFLAYASLCLARAALRGRRVPPPTMALATGVLMMLLDVVIDPVAVRGDRWFLGRIFHYVEAGAYFGVPLSNFAGWVLVGAVGTGVYVGWIGRPEAGWTRGWPGRGSRWSDTPARTLRQVEASARDPYGRRTWPGIALYYAVLAFNLGVTALIGEWLLLGVGAAVHVLTAAGLWTLVQRPAVRLGLEKQRA